MSFRDVFKQENIELVFNNIQNKDSFIAYADDCFSPYLKKDEFSFRWAQQFESGRYVIIVFQRFAAYENEKQTYLNDYFLVEVGKQCRYLKPHYVIVSDTAKQYYISTWKKDLNSHILHCKEDPLQLLTFTDVLKAQEEAIRYSSNGHRSAVLEWFEDYDMY